jgi:hypothetical protein
MIIFWLKRLKKSATKFSVFPNKLKIKKSERLFTEEVPAILTCGYFSYGYARS